MGKFEFRIASLEERRRFYGREFSIEKVKRWFSDAGMRLPQICAIDAGSESGVIVDNKLKGQMLYILFSELKSKIMKYLPEDIYYDRNLYGAPREVLKKLRFDDWKEQELVFNIDVENIKCGCSGICDRCVLETYNWALKMAEDLRLRGFNKIEIVYSGRGFHVHVLDRKGFLFSRAERRSLSAGFSRYPIDPWVSNGGVQLIRMPYSLHGLVSRITVPATKKFNAGRTIPKFLKD